MIEETDSWKRALTAALGSAGFEITYLPPGLIQVTVGDGESGKYMLRCTVVDIHDDLDGVLEGLENLFITALAGTDRKAN